MREPSEIPFAKVTRLSSAFNGSSAICTAVRRGDLIRAFPRVVIRSDVVDDPDAWMVAAHQWRPSAIITGGAALRALHGLPIGFPIVVADHLDRASTERVRFLRTRFPPELLIDEGAGAFTVDEVSVLVCAALGDFAPVCHALREKWVTLDTLHEAAALLPPRSWLGMAAPELLRDLRDTPWSVAELLVQRHLRKARITGWVANPTLIIAGKEYEPDLLFRRRRLIVEVVGLEFHSGKEAVRRDISRAADLLAAGYRIVSVTVDMVKFEPERVLGLIASQLGWYELRGSTWAVPGISARRTA